MRLQSLAIAIVALMFFDVRSAHSERLPCPVEDFTEICVFSKGSIDGLKSAINQRGWIAEDYRKWPGQQEGSLRASSPQGMWIDIEFQDYSEIFVFDCLFSEGDLLTNGKVLVDKMPQCADAIEVASARLGAPVSSINHTPRNLPSRSALYRIEAEGERSTIVVNVHKTGPDENQQSFAIMKSSRVVFKSAAGFTEQINSVPKG